MRVVIAEDSALLRAGIERILTDAGHEVVAGVPDATNLLRLVNDKRPDLAIVDVRMPPTFTDEGIRAAALLRRQNPESPVLVLSHYVEERYAADLIASDTKGFGYLLKDRVADVPAFLDAVEVVGAAPDTPLVQASGWGPVVGDGAGLVARLTQLLADGYRVVVAADGEGSADAPGRAAARPGPRPPGPRRRRGDLTKPGGHIVVAPLHHGVTLPGRQAGDRRRERPHRPPPRPPPARARGATRSAFFEDLKPGNYVVHVQHGVGRYEGMVKRTIGGVERDYLLVAYKGDDKLYVPSDQIDVLRQYVGGEAPALHRLGGSDFAKAKSRVRSAVREIAQELVVLYQKRVNAEGYAFGQDTPWQARDGGRLPVRRDARPARRHRRRQGRHGAAVPDGPPACAATSASARPRSPSAPPSRRSRTASRSPCSPRRRCWPRQHGNTFADRFAGYPIRVETLSRFLTPAQAREVVAGIESGDVDCVIGTHRLLGEQVRVQGPRPAGRRRGAALRRHSTRRR